MLLEHIDYLTNTKLPLLEIDENTDGFLDYYRTYFVTLTIEGMQTVFLLFEERTAIFI